jgi:hypothetical protein
LIAVLPLAALIQTGTLQIPNPGIQAFREACVEGSLRLSPERGRILKESEITTFVDLFEWGRATTRRTVIKLNNPPETYLVLADYTHLQRNSIANSCSLVSGRVSHEQAAAAFLEGLPDRNLLPYWMPNMNLPIWTADHPEAGYRKRLTFRNDGSIVLQIGLYKAKDADLKRDTTRQ